MQSYASYDITIGIINTSSTRNGVVEYAWRLINDGNLSINTKK
jgi:hypothetical protein